MDSLPRRSSLVAQTAVILRESIEAGVWKDFLPGEHELCERLQVSRVTLRAALLQLGREGWFQAQQGRRRQIVQKRSSKARTSRSDRVVMLSPVTLEKLQATTLFWVDALRDHLGAAGYRLEFHASHAVSAQHPEHALESLVQRFRPAGWVLYLSTAPVQEWFSKRGLPCVITGSPHPNVELSSVDMDYAATCSHAANLLAAKGRKRLALLMPRSGHAGNLESERGFMEAGEKLQAQGVHTLVSHHDGSITGICRALDNLLRAPQPATGILVAKPAHVITAVTHLLRRGVRLPEDVSLMARDDDPLLENLVPAVTRYHTDPVLFARKVSRLVVDLVRNGARRRHDSRLMPSLVRGETLG
ncbi:MAG TPA: GntR family transcriptional regulator [Verrucomicrobiae bacterium]|nr:GntR family transcriptional regulator [Verrucomicrobiae bacterium]